MILAFFRDFLLSDYYNFVLLLAVQENLDSTRKRQHYRLSLDFRYLDFISNCMIHFPHQVSSLFLLSLQAILFSKY